MIQGKAINQIDNILTIEIESDYQFSEMEPVQIESKKDTFRDELQGLFWVLLNWVVNNGHQFILKDGWKWFREGEAKAIALEKLYTLIRFEAGWLEVGYNKDGMQVVRAKSTSREKCSQRQLSDLYDKALNYIGTTVDLTQFEVQHQAARERLGKF